MREREFVSPKIAPSSKFVLTTSNLSYYSGETPEKEPERLTNGFFFRGPMHFATKKTTQGQPKQAL